jgi:hypothetical protein
MKQAAIFDKRGVGHVNENVDFCIKDYVFERIVFKNSFA